MGWNKTMNSEQLAAVEKLASVLARKLQLNPVVATLLAPAQITVKSRRGEYRKLSFNGDTKLTFNSAYAGKRDGVIVIGLPPADVASEIKTVEVPLNSIQQHFGPVVGKEINDHLTGAFEKAEAELQAAVEMQRAEQREKLADPAFGSW